MTLRLDTVSLHSRERPLLDAVSLTLHPGEIVAVIGPNGAGKSTLLRLASGLVAPTSGTVSLDGTPIGDLPPERLAARRAMLGQDSVLRARFSVAELVRLGIRPPCPSARREAIASEALRRVGLEAFAGRDVMSLSGGERQRAHLARVLAQLAPSMHAGRPGFLLLDEPISAQDLARQRLVMDIARDHARQGGGCLMVLHDLNWAASRADRILVLHHGRTCAEGAPAEVLTPDMLETAFDIAALRLRIHVETGRPFVIPHDFARFRATTERKRTSCTSP